MEVASTQGQLCKDCDSLLSIPVIINLGSYPFGYGVLDLQNSQATCPLCCTIQWIVDQTNELHMKVNGENNLSPEVICRAADSLQLHMHGNTLSLLDSIYSIFGDFRSTSLPAVQSRIGSVMAEILRSTTAFYKHKLSPKRRFRFPTY